MNQPEMHLEVLRFSSEKDSTNGLLFDITNGNRKFLCYTLEDEHRETKKQEETRVPPGTYRLSLRTEGGFHQRYTQKYKELGDWHKGMLWVRNVPNFEYILIHTGNTDEHTAGCLLVGNSQNNNKVWKNGFVGNSVNAYSTIYPYIANPLAEGKTASITYTDFDTV